MENTRMWGRGHPWRIVLAALIATACPLAACGHVHRHVLSDNHEMAMNLSLPPEAKIVRDESRGTIIFLKGPNLTRALEADPRFRELQAENQAEEIAKVFISAYSREFLLTDPFEELSVAMVTTDDLGLTHVKLRQVFKTIPVADSEIIVHLDRQQRVYLVNGRYHPTPDQLTLQPAISTTAAEAVVLENLEITGSDMPPRHVDLVIFPETAKGPRLAFCINISLRADEGWLFFIDAQSGEILEKRSLIRTSSDH
jgi:Zn-dependent metalloprotease